MVDAEREFAESVVCQLKEAGFTALWAGGCVRDLVLGHVPKDYDVATDARPEQVRKVFGRRRTLAVGESFGVIVVLGPRGAGQVEVATFRSDGQYLDGRRPESVEFSTPERDAQRRDFTINGMFYDPVERQVLDFVGGQEDLDRKVIRAIRDPRERMAEDKLRMLRAVRFAATFDFALEEATAEAIREMASQIDVVSAERIAQELRRMLAHQTRSRAVELCHEVALLHEILPELRSVTASSNAWQQLLKTLSLLGESEFSVALATLFAGVADAEELSGDDAAQTVHSAGRRLRLSNDEIHQALWIVQHRHDLADPHLLSMAKLKRVLTEPFADGLLQLTEAVEEACDTVDRASEFCRGFLARTPAQELNPRPLISGGDLIQTGMQPGPAFKEILECVRDAQLNGEIGSHEEAMQLVLRMQADK